MRKKAPIVVGLDPDYNRIPDVYKDPSISDVFERAAKAILQFNIEIMDAVHAITPAVKPQIAFYEQYGS